MGSSFETADFSISPISPVGSALTSSQEAIGRSSIAMIATSIAATGLPTQTPAPRLSASGISFNDEVDQFERDLILQALERTHWNKNKAAQLLGLNRTTLVEKIRKKGLKPASEL